MTTEYVIDLNYSLQMIGFAVGLTDVTVIAIV